MTHNYENHENPENPKNAKNDENRPKIDGFLDKAKVYFNVREAPFCLKRGQKTGIWSKKRFKAG